MPPEAPSLLVGAITRLRGNDDVVSFDDFAPEAAIEGSVTALCELAMTLSLLGPQARAALPTLKSLVADDNQRFSPSVRAALGEALESLARPESAAVCCGPEPVAEPSPAAVQIRTTSTPTTARDDPGSKIRTASDFAFAEAFSSRPTALAWFYTRCTNPEKCSLTVTRPGAVGSTRRRRQAQRQRRGHLLRPGLGQSGPVAEIRHRPWHALLVRMHSPPHRRRHRSTHRGIQTRGWVRSSKLGQIATGSTWSCSTANSELCSASSAGSGARKPCTTYSPRGHRESRLSRPRWPRG